MFDVAFPYTESHCSDDRIYLQTEYLTAANSILQLTDEMLEEFVKALDTIRSNERLRETVHGFHMQLFHSGDEEAKASAIQQLFEFDESDGLGGMLVPVVLNSGIPYTIRSYRERNIPEAVLIDTLSDLKLNLRKYKEQHGRWGTKNVKWLIMHFSGTIFRLGRLQFHFIPFPHKIFIFQHSGTGEITVFSDEGVPFRKDGKVDGTNGIYDKDWVSQFSLTDEWIKGHCISKDGEIRKEMTRIARKDWQLVCKQGDPVLKVHIPADGKLTYESCQASYIQAVEFFSEYFAEVTFEVIFCVTWLLSPQWKSLLPPESNIVKFQQDYSFFPIQSNDTQTMQRVFGVDRFDAAQAPRNTQLQRVLIDYLSAGHHIHSGAGFILKNPFAAHSLQRN